jgi:tetratricopeptide (TPR) repeat protein
MVEQDLNQLPPEQRGYAIRAREELEEMMRANADFPAGRLQLGDYYYRRGELPMAIKQYEMAIKMDSLLTAVYSNLATAYNMVNDNPRALATLDKLLEIEPEYGRGYYLRGLLQHEIGNVLAAIDDLELAIKFDPYNFRAFYNLANLYLSDGDLVKAEKTINKGLLLQPDSEEGIYLLNLIKSQSNG